MSGPCDHYTFGGRPLNGGRSLPPVVLTECGAHVPPNEVTDVAEDVGCPACLVVMQARSAADSAKDSNRRRRQRIGSSSGFAPPEDEES
jgi:hypothetical protein